MAHQRPNFSCLTPLSPLGLFLWPKLCRVECWGSAIFLMSFSGTTKLSYLKKSGQDLNNNPKGIYLKQIENIVNTL